MRQPYQRLAAASLALAASAAQAQDPFAPLAIESRPLQTRWQSDYSGWAELGLSWTSDDNFSFGQYNGLHEQGANLVGNLAWQDFRSGNDYWQAELRDLGLDTREGRLNWGIPGRISVVAGFDHQLQVRNDSGRTPFRGNSELRLPDNWVSGLTTRDFASLDENLLSVRQEVERQQYFLEVAAPFAQRWELRGALRHEDREGSADLAGAIYTDAASGDSVMLPQPVDHRTTELDLGLAYSGARLHLDGLLAWSEFDNRDELLSWQNPYASFGPRVRYPEGQGAIALAPDNEQLSGRLTGHYIFSSTARLQLDGSYAVTRQDHTFPDYSINPLLLVDEELPRDNLDGEVATGIFKAKLLMQPLRKLNLELRYRARDRDYDVPRDGYRYIRGDATDQPRQALTAYSSSGRDYTAQSVGIEGGYRLPLSGKLELDYEFEEIERRNAAVAETQEDRFGLRYRIRPWQNFSARLELGLGNRAADTYQWDQSYYALLDPELINATPDNQRYITHPLLSQYHLANRERLEGKVDLNYLLGTAWNLALNLSYRDDDFDKSELGLRDARWQRLYLSAAYAPSSALSLTLYAGADDYRARQGGRAFRGGQEKNAFAVVPPLPQASDPSRDWRLDAEDQVMTLGANLQWLPREQLELRLDYSFSDTTSEQDYRSGGAADLDPQALPDVETYLHHLEATGTWHLDDRLSVRFDYRYHRYKSDDWAWQGVAPDTLDKVLGFGQRNPNEQVHYVGTSVLYRWQ